MTYFVRTVNGALVGDQIPCTNQPVVVNGSCLWSETDDGFRIWWQTPTGTSDVVIVRSLDAGPWHWRAKVADNTHSFDDGPLPNGTDTVAYWIRLETNSGPEIICTDAGPYGVSSYIPMSPRAAQP